MPSSALSVGDKNSVGLHIWLFNEGTKCLSTLQIIPVAFPNPNSGPDQLKLVDCT